MQRYRNWLKACAGQAVKGVPAAVNARTLCAGRFGYLEGDDDDDLWCNFMNYGPFSDDREK